MDRAEVNESASIKRRPAAAAAEESTQTRVEEGDGCDDDGTGAVAQRPVAAAVEFTQDSEPREADGGNCKDDVGKGTALRHFCLYGWMPDPTLTDDDNYLDLMMLVTRNSTLRQGSMGCVLVRRSSRSTDGTSTNGSSGGGNSEEFTRRHRERIFGSVLAAATNEALFTEGNSDVHAEIRAIGQAARGAARDRSSEAASATWPLSLYTTEGCTAYITMPPCRRCFAALDAAGVQRIVSRRSPPPALVEVATRRGIEMQSMTDEGLVRQRERIDVMVRGSGSQGVGGCDDGCDKQREISEERKRRREEKRQQKEEKRLRQQIQEGQRESK